MSVNPAPQRPTFRSDTLRSLTLAGLDGVVALEQAVYPFPWSRGNFVDSLAAGYLALTLNSAGGELIGYCIAMRGAGELHLLNITVTPLARRRGHARRLLAELAAQGRHDGVATLWLEVRASNEIARKAYLRLGFAEVGVRRRYYPAPADGREDAIVMSLRLDEATGFDALE
ncbi:MAG: ribosomal protein S18-alanine N-acetyltransferase [Pseudomonadota bacterium]|nr:ribosomal protein S18-alanine N-acetyltransferase [Pseudomonadota bacterium]